MSAKFPRGGGAGPFLARSLLVFINSESPSVMILRDSVQFVTLLCSNMQQNQNQRMLLPTCVNLQKNNFNVNIIADKIAAANVWVRSNIFIHVRRFRVFLIP